MLKILIFGVTPAQGGIETFVLNVCKVTQGLAKVYLYNFSDSEVAYQNTFQKKYGVNIFNNITKRNIIGHMTRKFQYKKFFKHHKFDIVHINANSPSNYDFAQEALRSGAKVIYHSHNDSSESFVLNKKAKKIINIVRAYQRFRLNRLSISRVAVSQDAAKWMFGKIEDVMILPNGVDFKTYKFSEKKRLLGRKSINIDGKDRVLIAASRLTHQKNFGKVVSVAKVALEKNFVQNLLIVGDGEELTNIKKIIENFPVRVQSQIKLLGSQEDMQFWYSVADVLIMPSLYEGLPYSILEAQANGLKCIVSEAIPEKAIINKRLVSINDVNLSDEIWAGKVSGKNFSTFQRNEAYKIVQVSDYSLEKFLQYIIKLYKI